MSPLLKDYLNKKIVIITTEGRCLLATLEGFDKNTNLVLSQVHDRFGSSGVVQAVQLLRGSEVVSCGLLDDGYDEADDLSNESVTPLKDTKNRIEDEYAIWEKIRCVSGR
ncbi:hypothetical protein Kpol_1010p42 [Vanderwaltozyma polyspora DSM 70294]|uniref:LSM2-LSM8 complex subunit LSM8 n=1 Tax=Vanderwaltozyma polyspora (strain ATCC 22028 / DSM 70294 / BCRC 21397 / CBS 2163 / NBRC 10782 / NRRL Y-8283 / UCD 57-17) TaxID=436907 RepID=A7TII8_VANPO|nr:uncharacterized protein Kpol_1010p42 [Vanderwaltozyma polyspora DSM 70294]EDO17926.1 hypothetical protein Kpol_1010p42 [Vanderwaltozyma polyspora DSM 70294]